MSKKSGKYATSIKVPRSPAVRTLEKQIHQPISISFRKVKEGESHCLSLCEKDEVRAYVKAFRLLTTMSWLEVTRTGGKGKTGLGYTLYDGLRFEGISPDVTISGLRAGERERFFGYHLDHVYYVVKFDPKHEIVPV